MDRKYSFVEAKFVIVIVITVSTTLPTNHLFFTFFYKLRGQVHDFFLFMNFPYIISMKRKLLSTHWSINFVVFVREILKFEDLKPPTFHFHQTFPIWLVWKENFCQIKFLSTHWPKNFVVFVRKILKFEDLKKVSFSPNFK